MSEVQEIEKVIQEALARGYASKENESKTLDPTLIEAMTKELMIVFDKELPETVILAYRNFPKNNATVSELLDELILKGKRKR